MTYGMEDPGSDPPGCVGLVAAALLLALLWSIWQWARLIEVAWLGVVR